MERRKAQVELDHEDRRKSNGNGRYVNWKWMVGILLILVFSAYGLIVADTRSDISTNRAKIERAMDQKLDKEQYYRDIGDIKESLREIKDSLRRHEKN